ncbi:hypothetical protein [Thioalkalivibrio denitrificans]|uniref:hypothetical protein n=1 Tax=Thioalkalivibrio denitrificans TaxID=108003 RepID=UPI001115A18C|nr:hypothetical protein [Thioalkalivibrio denitrificans]
MNDKTEPQDSAEAEANAHASLEFERTKYEAIQEKEDREYQLRLRELELREREANRSQLKNPLVLAIVAATLAAIGNGVVAWVNADNQRKVEENRESLSKELESRRVESLAMLEVLKSEAPCDGVSKLQVALDIGLVSDSNRQAELRQFLSASSDSNQCPQATVDSKPIVAPVEPITVSLSTGWLGGGHNQLQQCRILRSAVESEYPDRTILLVGSSEESKKDFLGRVEYKYFCTFEVQ